MGAEISPAIRHHFKLGNNRISTVKAFERAGWTVRGQKGSHVKLTKEGNPHILSIPVHKGKPVKKGLLLNQIKKAGLSPEEFLEHYK